MIENTVSVRFHVFARDVKFIDFTICLDQLHRFRPDEIQRFLNDHLQIEAEPDEDDIALAQYLMNQDDPAKMPAITDQHEPDHELAALMGLDQFHQ